MDTQPGPEYFGRWLDLTMANRNIKGRTLAKRVDVHDSAVSRWRSGAGVPALPTLQLLAKALGVDAVRLAVTAGLLDPSLVGQEPLPMPEPTAQRALVKEQLSKIRGLLPEERQALINFYDGLEGQKS
jgi:transcriptional regulator with XRE-family HTH domain